MGLLSAAACGPATVRQSSYPDPEVPCPGGRPAWNLLIVDQRADQVVSERMIHDVRDAIQKSFPGCKWTSDADAHGDTITIEIHRLASHYSEGGWDAAADWSVTVRSAQGGTLTEFDANEEASSPNYSGRDNEKETLSEAFRKAIERTAKGLRGVSAAENARPRQETPEGGEAASAARPLSSNSSSSSHLAQTARTSAPSEAWNGSRSRALPEVL